MVLNTSRRAGKSKTKVMRTVRRYLTLFLDRGRWARQANQYLGQPIKHLDEIITRR